MRKALWSRESVSRTPVFYTVFQLACLRVLVPSQCRLTCVDTVMM